MNDFFILPVFPDLIFVQKSSYNFHTQNKLVTKTMEVKKVKGKVILFSALALLMLFAAASPVFAGFPKHGTFTQIIVSGVGPKSSPGTTWTKGDIEYIVNAFGYDYIYGAPWGNSLTSSGPYSLELNTVSYTGWGVGYTVDTYSCGTIKGVLFLEFKGLGYFTYTGPSFQIATLDGANGLWVTSGVTYFGLLYNVWAVKQGVSGYLNGIVLTERSTGLLILAGTLAGHDLAVDTVTYNFP